MIKMQTFLDYFDYHKENIFIQIHNNEIPDKEELFEIFKLSPIILNNFMKVKNPKGLPEISDEFKNYINKNINIGYFEDSLYTPIWYSNKNSFDILFYTPPEILHKAWLNIIELIIWFKQLLKDGYYYY